MISRDARRFGTAYQAAACHFGRRAASFRPGRVATPVSPGDDVAVAAWRLFGGAFADRRGLDDAKAPLLLETWFCRRCRWDLKRLCHELARPSIFQSRHGHAPLGPAPQSNISSSGHWRFITGEPPFHRPSSRYRDPAPGSRALIARRVTRATDATPPLAPAGPARRPLIFIAFAIIFTTLAYRTAAELPPPERLPGPLLPGLRASPMLATRRPSGCPRHA